MLRANIIGGSNTLYYILKDHLGSASVVTDNTINAAIVGEQRYYPYGETRFTSGTIYTDKLFTGQRDVALRIYHYGARFYSQKLGRFLSADSIVPDQFNPQDLNRFSYVRNNPVRYTDPTGHALDDGGLGGCYPCTEYPPQWPGPLSETEPPGPIIDWPDPDPPVVLIPPVGIGPIIIPAPGTSPLSPTTRICQLLENMINLTELQLNALDYRIGGLLDKLKNTRDRTKIQEIIREVKRLEEERKRVVITLKTLRNQAKAEGCDL